jgi:hypothetical protein
MWVIKTSAEMNVLAIAIPDRHHGCHLGNSAIPNKLSNWLSKENVEMTLNDTKHKKAWKKKRTPLRLSHPQQ